MNNTGNPATPGKDIPVADALSRISSCYGEALQGLDVSVHEVRLPLNESPTCVSQIREETDKDTTSSALREIIMPCLSSCLLELS